MSEKIPTFVVLKVEVKLKSIFSIVPIYENLNRFNT